MVLIPEKPKAIPKPKQKEIHKQKPKTETESAIMKEEPIINQKEEVESSYTNESDITEECHKNEPVIVKKTETLVKTNDKNEESKKVVKVEIKAKPKGDHRLRLAGKLVSKACQEEKKALQIDIIENNESKKDACCKAKKDNCKKLREEYENLRANALALFSEVAGRATKSAKKKKKKKNSAKNHPFDTKQILAVEQKQETHEAKQVFLDEKQEIQDTKQIFVEQKQEDHDTKQIFPEPKQAFVDQKQEAPEIKPKITKEIKPKKQKKAKMSKKQNMRKKKELIVYRKKEPAPMHSEEKVIPEQETHKQLPCNQPPMSLKQKRELFYKDLEIEIEKMVEHITEYNIPLKEISEIIRQRIQNVAEETFPYSKNEIEAAIYGSVASGLALEGSDIDISIRNLKITSNNQFLDFLTESLSKMPEVISCKEIRGARVPVTKLVKLYSKVLIGH